jgi:hypothetical protein
MGAILLLLLTLLCFGVSFSVRPGEATLTYYMLIYIYDGTVHALSYLTRKNNCFSKLLYDCHIIKMT